ncbi:hypothetical protein BHE90_007194 [Fusarium euwallaceae]|uniref:Uncharacterized protein n=2 Tax=Fusarium solani species complex TaxID=232080 RepID=A0A3M2SKT3_9HYPO|nr:hypothetical protein CDV36_002111 [Fusarium kuroshium]RTE78291.1 hypothetical protein BHE90_007194 [Fusarium euwallaceae]
MTMQWRSAELGAASLSATVHSPPGMAKSAAPRAVTLLVAAVALLLDGLDPLSLTGSSGMGKSREYQDRTGSEIPAFQTPWLRVLVP